jgi:hypothetical protein
VSDHVAEEPPEPEFRMPLVELKPQSGPVRSMEGGYAASFSRFLFRTSNPCVDDAFIARRLAPVSATPTVD